MIDREKKNKHRARLQRIGVIIEIGNDGDFISRFYDILSTFIVVLNLLISIALTFENVEVLYGSVLESIEAVTYIFFGVEFFLRVITAGADRPELRRDRAIFKYLFSFMGIVDLFSFLPYYLPAFFPEGAVAFRMFRVVRIFRLFRINVYYDSLNVIAEVLISKSQQLLSSVFIIGVLMTASSLCMYSLEHDAQPDVFKNAFSGIWWSVSTLLTVGYGDIYPITTMGRVFGIAIAFLGVGMVAIPTGIISAGFIDQYQRAKQPVEGLVEGSVKKSVPGTFAEPNVGASVNLTENCTKEGLRYMKVQINAGDGWCGRMIGDLDLPAGIFVGAVWRRDGQTLAPDRGVVLQDLDEVILFARNTE